MAPTLEEQLQQLVDKCHDALLFTFIQYLLYQSMFYFFHNLSSWPSTLATLHEFMTLQYIFVSRFLVRHRICYIRHRIYLYTPCYMIAKNSELHSEGLSSDPYPEPNQSNF